MMRTIYLLLLLQVLTLVSTAQKRNALLIGINEYSPSNGYFACKKFQERGINNLDGPLNDVASISSVITSRFGFPSKNIDTLINKKANREGILSGIRKLLSNCQRGDFAFIFYAGHGSQIKNSLSNESDKMDETIVPADAWKEGVKDIRDKELAPLFIDFLKKGVSLTVMFDCCHSGSLERGNIIGFTPKARNAKSDDEDIKDSYEPPPYSSIAGADYLFISASQDNEPAKELIKEGVSIGSLTHAFYTAFQQLPTNSTPDLLFQYIRSVLKSERLWQEPSISMSESRKGKTFLGLSSAQVLDKILIPVYDVQEESYFLQGGYAIGLSLNSELVHIEHSDTSILIVDSIFGPTTSKARLKKGKPESIKPGSFFEIVSWSSVPLLYIYIPAEKDVPISAINKKLAIALSAKLKTNNLLKETPFIEQADYFLSTIGTAKNGGVMYCLKSLREDVNDKIMSMPVVSKETIINENSEESVLLGATNIYHKALQLAKLKGWIQLSPPPGLASRPPFRLELADLLGKVRADNSAAIGEKMSLHLVLEESYAPGEFPQSEIEWYYYLFTVDNQGRMRLRRPSMKDNHSCASEINRITKEDYKTKRKPLINFPVEAPVGIDYFFLLFTNRQISNCGQAFNQSGVEAMVTKDGDPLSKLLNLGNENFNVRDVVNSERWGLLKVAITTEK
jgi:Caspase domain